MNTHISAAKDIKMDHAHVSIFGQLKSEWIKVWGTPSSIVSVVIAIGVYFGLSLLVLVAVYYEPQTRSQFSPAMVTAGIVFAQLVIATFACMVITSEWRTGQIRTTLAASPGRIGPFLSKSVVTMVTAFALGAACALVLLLAARGIYGSHSIPLDTAKPWSLVWGSGLALVFVAIMCQGFSLIVRSTPAAITISVLLLFILPVFVPLLSLAWKPFEKVIPYLPSGVVSYIAMPLYNQNGPAAPVTWGIILAALLYVLIPYIVGLVLLKVRDA